MSDIQFECPHCNETLIVEDDSEGVELECPSCSGLLIVPEADPIPVTPIRTRRPAPTPKKTSRSKTPAIIGMLLTVLVCGAVVAIVVRNKSASKAAAAQAYRADMAEATKAIIDEAAQCVKVCTLISAEWQNFQKHSSGRTQIVSLEDRLAPVLKKHADSLASYKSAIDASVSDLSTPPQSLQSVHKTFTSLYDIYEQLQELASAPTGSYEQYLSRVSELEDSIKELESNLNAQFRQK